MVTINDLDLHPNVNTKLDKSMQVVSVAKMVDKTVNDDKANEDNLANLDLWMVCELCLYSCLVISHSASNEQAVMHAWNGYRYSCWV